MKSSNFTDVARDTEVARNNKSVHGHLVSFCVTMAAYCGILAAGWFFQTTAQAGWQRENLHWNFFLHGFMLFVPMISMLCLGRSAREYGLSSSAWQDGMKISVLGAVIFLAFVLIGISTGALDASKTFIAFPISTVIYQVIFVAIFEEIFFRGFLQHELGRSWPRGGGKTNRSAAFGWLAAAVLFGLGHGLGRFNPFLNSYQFGAGAFLAAFALGCVLGLLRVQSGSIWPSVLLHLAANLSTTIFFKPTSSAGQILILMGFYTALPLVAFLCIRKQNTISA